MISPAKPSDANALTEIALVSKAYWGYTAAQIESWREDLTILPETFDCWTGSKFSMDTEIAGFYLLNNINDKTWCLEFLFIDPKYMGKGIGNQLIIHAIEHSKVNRCKVLSVLSDPNAESFYAKYGFKTISEKESSIPKRFLPEMEIRFSENR